MRILLNASYAPSLINFRGPLIRELIARGHDVHCVAPDISDEVQRGLAELNASSTEVTLVRAGLAPHQDLRYFLDLRKVMKKFKPEFVLNYTIKPNIWGSLAAKSLGIKSASMITGLGYSFIENGSTRQAFASFVARKLYRAATSANSVVVFQNMDDRDDFVSADCLSDPDKARLIRGSGVDVSFFRERPLPKGPVFLMVARLLINKGVREYGEAASRLLKEGVDARFLLVGYFDEGPDGIGREELDRWTSAGLEYLGHLDDVRPALRECSVFVLPSYREGTPRSVLEAMSVGRPIITTDVPGCRDTVEHGTSGLLVDAQEIGPLAEAMRSLAENQQRRTSMGAAARKRAEEVYAVDKVNAVLLSHLGLT